MNNRVCAASSTLKPRRPLRLAPIAHAAALLLASTGAAHAQKAFSPSWFAGKGVAQSSAAATGYLPNGTPAAALVNPAQQQQQANAQLQASFSNLSALARGIAASQAAQAAARQAALAAGGSVPDGLVEGGLKVDTNSLTQGWINAGAPTQSVAGGKTMVTILQNADKAILNWESFNVGQNTIVHFAQAANWAVLNRVNDPLARPSQIQGQVKGDGTVMIVNRNGVVFSGSSQVDTRNLVVAAAAITDTQFRNNGIYGTDANSPSFTDANGKLVVALGARISTAVPAAATQGGGYVLLLGSEVDNAGSISTARGQTQLAAGDSFIIRRGVASDANTYSTTRGNEISPGVAPGSAAGKVVNSGLIVAGEGDVTLAGRDVQQNGVALATTTVNARGTIHLLNAASDAQGKVTLGAGSNTAVLIDDDGVTTALDSQRDSLVAASAAQDLLRANATAGKFDNLSRLSDRRDQSRIEIVSGGDVEFQDSSTTLATGGQIAVSATRRSFVGSGATLDVSGAVGVQLAMEANSIKVNVQGNELRDAPLVRDAGKLANSDVWIDTSQLIYVPAGTGGYTSDRWYSGGGLLEVGGYLGNRGHRIGEWAAQGGTVTLGGTEVITQSGSRINLSGGSLDVRTGYINTTWIKGADGRLYDINHASADIGYGGIYRGFEIEHARWGSKATEYFYNPLIAPQRVLRDGYTVGRDAGALVISAPTAVLEGQVDASVYNGPSQNGARASVSDSYRQVQGAAARAGALMLGRYGALGRIDLFNSDVRIGDVAQVSVGLQMDDALDALRLGTVWLDAAMLNAQGLGVLDLGTRGALSVGRDIRLADGGQLALTAASIDLAASVVARSGSVRASNIFQSSVSGAVGNALTQGGASNIVLRQGATLDLRGIQPGQSAGNNAQAYLNGGNVTLESTHDVRVEAGSRIDVSSGATLAPQARAVGGRGGNVTLVADSGATATNGNGVLVLAGEIAGYGVKGGGKLKIETGTQLVIGGDAVAGALQMDTARLQSGFSTYDLNGHAGLRVADGAQVDVNVPVYDMAGDANGLVLARWLPDQAQADLTRQNVIQRQGADLVLRAQRRPEQGGDIRIGRGAVVAVDPGCSISLMGGGLSNIVVEGRLNAWGGNIALGVEAPALTAGSNVSQQAHQRSIWIGDGAVLDVAARAISVSGGNGRRFGVVADGGTISIGGGIDWEGNGVAAAPDVAVIVRPGALLDASGSRATLDYQGGPLEVASNGGSIILKSSHSLYLDGVMRARAGGTGAAGGTLAIALETPIFGVSTLPQDAVRAQRELVISQQQRSSLMADLAPGQTDPALRYGAGRLAADQVSAGGFDNLSLLVNGLLSFEGDVSLATRQSMRLYAGAYGLSQGAAADSTVRLASSYLRLAGTTGAAGDGQRMFSVNWRSGASTQASAAQLSAVADLVEIRDRAGFGGASGTIQQSDNSSISIDRRGFDQVDIVSRGELRLLGGMSARGLSGTTTTELASSGDLRITAAQIYPVTGADAQIVAGYGSGRMLDIHRYADLDPGVPFSVFGRLALGGDIVRQGGIVRAPLGQLLLGADAAGAYYQHSSLVELLAGSITSISAAGLTLPYGGTIDGLTYGYNGATVTQKAIGASNITFSGDRLVGRDGALLDLSGGGTLTGAGFISGRGGSVDILRTPLVNANPTFAFSQAGNAVYAIMPGSSPDFAPVAPDAGAGNPMVGRQITLKQDMGALKAGTYTLLPSTFATLPGAYRIEIGATGAAGGVAVTGNGSYAGSAYLGVAKTGILAALPSNVLVTPGTQLRKHSSYNETGYDAFVIADALRKGGMRGELAADAHRLVLDFANVRPNGGQSMLSFEGEARFQRADRSAFGGTLEVVSEGIEVLSAGAAPTPGFAYASLRADDLNAFGASRMILGGSLRLNHADNFATFDARASSVILRSGASLRAPEVFLLSTATSYGSGTVVEQGASILTIGRGPAAYDSTDGVTFAAGNASVLGLSNGWINLLGSSNGGTIDVGHCTLVCSGSSLLVSEGTLAVATNQSFIMADDVRYGTRNLMIAVSSLNMGSAAALAQAAGNQQLPGGLSMNQDALSRLLAGNTGEGIPAVETLAFNVRESINMYGEVDFDARSASTGKSALQRLVIGTPAIYGYGAAGEIASIKADEIVWTGSTATRSAVGNSAAYVPAAAGPAITSLLGDSTLALSAERIILGQAPNTQPVAGVSSDRLALGFGKVDLNASQQLSSNGQGSLSVYHRQGAYVAGSGYQYSDGDLGIATPLITGTAASIMRVTAGGNIVATGAMAAASTVAAASSDALGAELQFSGRNISLDTRVALASGKLGIHAGQDINLGGNAAIDLSGRAVRFFEQTRYSRGGDLILDSSAGNIVQAPGSVVDLSALNNRAGSLQAVALGTGAGAIDLAGSILGRATGSYDAGGSMVPFDGGEITVRGQTIADLAGLNVRLNGGEVFGARRFQTKQGDLVVGNEIKARQVEIAVDGGSLTVNGVIDASGVQVGSIRLAARNRLDINGTLDAHGEGLRVDSYGGIIDSANRALVELTTIDGMLTLAASARIDLRSGTTAAGNDGMARGSLSLNAPRTGGSGGSGTGANDVAVTVLATPAISGARSIAVNGFRRYDDAPLATAPDASGSTPQLITQAYLDQIDLHSQAFMNAALANTGLASRLAGLGGYHLRPGVEIVSNAVTNPGGNLSVVGDIDLSGYRYGAQADRLDPARRGFGEPGVLVLRAAGELSIYGSMTDGFAPPAATPDDRGWYLTEAPSALNGSGSLAADIVVPIDGVVLETGTFFPKGVTLNYNVPVQAMTLPGGTVLPTAVTLGGDYTMPAGTVVAATVYNADGSVALAAGTVLSASVSLHAGMILGAGNTLRSAADVAAMVWPKGVLLPVDMTTDSNLTLARGSLIPSMARVQLAGDNPVNLRPDATGAQGANWAVAPMLPRGTTSWSMQLTAGADLGSADRRATTPGASGSIVLADTHSMSRIVTIPGGSGQVWSATNPMGYTPGDPVSIDDASWACVGTDWCNIDPKRLSYTFTADGSLAINGDTSLTGQKVDDIYLSIDFCNWDPGYCVSVVNPVKDVTTTKLLSPMFSVLRTGTGDLGLNAAQDLRMMSPFGVYTAGMPSAARLDASGVDAYNRARGLKNGSAIGLSDAAYDDALASYQAWYPELGGNLTVDVGRNILGDVWGSTFNQNRVQLPSAGVGNWLWRQGSGTVGGADAVATAWWINFGSYVAPFSGAATDAPYLVGFTGLGTLGGGNLAISAGGDAGVISQRGDESAQEYPRSQALVAAVASTGRVGADGSLIQTGGGDLRLRVGGSINPATTVLQYGSGGASIQQPDLNGVLTNLRGTLTVEAGAMGSVLPRYRSLQSVVRGVDGDAADVRAIDPYKATIALSGAGLGFMPGDSPVYVDTRRDLVVSDIADPGRVFVDNTSSFTANGVHYDGGGQSWFSLWTGHTAINLFASGGNLTPGTQPVNRIFNGGNANLGDLITIYPAILRATAASGSIYYGFSAAPASSLMASGGSLLLAPSAQGALEMLAADSLYGGNYGISMSNADTVLPGPKQPAFAGFNIGFNGALIPGSSNLGSEGSVGGNIADKVTLGTLDAFPLFAFGPDTPQASSLHAGDRSRTLFYAAGGDVIGLSSGTLQLFSAYTERAVSTWYRAALPARVQAGRDIINAKGLFLHNNADDISLIQAGRDILYADVKVAGPGTLELSAGRDVRQEDKGSLSSIGAVIAGDNRPGADLAIMAGVANGVDFAAVAQRYLTPSNQADPGLSLASQPGKVVKTYQAELATWLAQRFGFSGAAEQALDYFKALAPEQQRVFLRAVYYNELREGGREFNNPDSRRFGSFQRSRNMIAALFPDQAADGGAIRRQGDITLFGDSGIHTDFGGNIQMMAPGGQIVVGVQGPVPAASAGLITQGSGDIQLFSEQSLLLGLSRIMTTFGGDIFAWSEQGDINAGRGSKTTQLYTPPKRVYDQWGNVTVSPQVPSAGAGIATLSPIPQARAGDVDLIAPLGTIDAGEAGIRVSGNVNIFAQQVVNAANIQVKGEASGLPAVASVNVASLSNASAAASSAAMAAQDTVQRARDAARQALPSVFTVRVLGFGDGGADSPRPAVSSARPGYDRASFVQVAGHGQEIRPELVSHLTDEEKRLLRQDR
ncbi:filamentous haemagglutinin family protein [Herbaspirillum frisingense]|uniref:filamentous haemagglutinin family protein n=1 Tax=Herbaspirillum frisingense TaxID=92645 RepID=UPI001F18F5B1|nr:filamentous haemagglutinin family protein [Herbaspirillum frisingense]UIN21430.1 filamentous hemagglutinin family protein [Herbaspirillum frisingense]